MKKMYTLVVIACIATFSQCKESTDAASQDNRVASNVTNYCTSCHSPDRTATRQLAPTLHEVKTSYRNAYGSQDAFVQAMASFLNQPTVEQAIMNDAVATYGAMPNLGLSPTEYEEIATFLSKADMDDDSWLRTSPSSEWTASQDIDWQQRGKDIALRTKATLGKNLLSAIKTKGASGAITFCSERAIVLTDSMAITLGASVKRVTDKCRNPSNCAIGEELDYISTAKAAIVAGKTPTPYVNKQDDVVTGYYPIMTNAMCLQCHGKASNIGPETKAQLSERYPEDLAIGYGEGELRGIWVVEMPVQAK